MVAAAALTALPGAAFGLRPTQVRADVVSGSPELKRTENGSLKRWQEREITVHVDASVSQFAPGAYEAVAEAFGAWQASGAELPRVTVDQIDGASAGVERDGRNSVVLAPIDIPGHESDLAITVSHVDAQTGEIVEADVIINSRKAFVLMEDDVAQGSDTALPGNRVGQTPAGPGQGDSHQSEAVLAHGRSASGPSEHEPDGIPSCQQPLDPSELTAACGSAHDFQNVVTHEIGHFFGLGEDTEDAYATMFNCSNPCETHKRSLTLADAEALEEVYADGFEDEPARCNVDAAGVATHGAGRWFALAVFGLVSAARRRRGRVSAG